MCAEKELSTKTKIIWAVKPNGQERFFRDASCPETPVYRARNPGGDPLSRIVLNNLPEFEQLFMNYNKKFNIEKPREILDLGEVQKSK